MTKYRNHKDISGLLYTLLYWGCIAIFAGFLFTRYGKILIEVGTGIYRWILDVTGIKPISKTNKAGTHTNGSAPNPSGSTRGIRNNNPGNIKISASNDWKGKIQGNTDGTFEQFTDISYGLRAMFMVLDSYIKAGHSTIEKIANRWANNPGATYVKYLSDQTGLSKGTALALGDKANHMKLVKALGIIESHYPATDAELSKAYDSK